MGRQTALHRGAKGPGVIHLILHKRKMLRGTISAPRKRTCVLRLLGSGRGFRRVFYCFTRVRSRAGPFLGLRRQEGVPSIVKDCLQAFSRVGKLSDRGELTILGGRVTSHPRVTGFDELVGVISSSVVVHTFRGTRVGNTRVLTRSRK